MTSRDIDNAVAVILENLEEAYTEQAEFLVFNGKYKNPRRKLKEVIRRLRGGVEGSLQWA